MMLELSQPTEETGMSDQADGKSLSVCVSVSPNDMFT